MDIHKAAYYIQVMDELRVRHGIQTTIEAGWEGNSGEKFIQARVGNHLIEFFHTMGLEPDKLCIQWTSVDADGGVDDFHDGEVWTTASRADWPEVSEVANSMRKFYEKAIEKRFADN